MSKKRIILIDLSGIYWANWHATADGAVSEAFERTVKKVNSFSRGAGGDLVAVCCDSPPYWRKDLLPDYKANREAAPAMAREQFERVKERLRQDGLLLWSAPGFEADDVIAWATGHAMEAGHDVVIVSNDKDLHQLVGMTVRVFAPMHEKMYDEKAVFEKHGVYPAHIIDFLALCGDKSDNVPGVPNVGPKTAAAMLEKLGSLDAIIAEADKEDGLITREKLRAAIRESASLLKVSQKVIELRADVTGLDFDDIYKEQTPAPLPKREVEGLDADEVVAEVSQKLAEAAANVPNTIVTSEELDTTPSEPAPVVQAKPASEPPPSGNGHALARTQDWALALEPSSSKGAWAAAQLLFDSRMCGKFKNAEGVYMAIMRGRALGMDATTSINSFHDIEGKLGMHADLIEALVLRSPKCEYFEFTETTNEKATYVTKRRGGRSEKTMTFTIDDAAAAGLVTREVDANGVVTYKGVARTGNATNWDKARADMLRHRCKTKLARAVYPDVVLGLYSTDELASGVIDVEVIS